jgi:5-methyltetrahydrofolate--homocysteine methyltransferase
MKRVTLLDGAFGTCLWEAAQEKGIKKTPTWMYNVDQPGLVAGLISSYADAGSEIIYSNTFTATRSETDREGYDLREVITSGIMLVKESADVKAAYSIGPLMKMMQPYGELTRLQVSDIYREVFEIAATAEPDFLVLETFFDLNMLETAAEAAKETGLPLICSMSFTETGKTYLGYSAGDMIKCLLPFSPAAIGMNCSVGPDYASKLIAEFVNLTDLPLLVKPNASGSAWSYSPAEFADALTPALEKVSYAGACCGSSPDYIRELKRRNGK